MVSTVVLSDSIVCPDCNGEYEQLGKHLTGSCDPEITDHQKELIDALVIGDGTIYNGGSGNHRLTVVTVREEYAKYIAGELGWLYGSTNVSESESPNNKTQYHVRTICHPFITKQRNRWYTSDQKRIPDDFDVSPLILKHWMCADGNYSKNADGGRHRYKIGNSMEMDRPGWIEELFPFPATYAGYEICFLTKDTHKIAEYMGSPPPGFDYKWPEDYRSA